MGSRHDPLIGCCGLYCGACGIHQGKIKEAVQNLRKVTQAYGFDKIPSELSKWEPAFLHYKEFEEVLKGFERMFHDCPGCGQNGGDPGCLARSCCRQRSLSICAQCIDLEPCEKLSAERKGELRQIKANGTENWMKEMRKRVADGYCYLDDMKRQP